MDSTDFALIIDAGGFAKGYGTAAALQTEYLLKGMSLLNYDVVNLATKDFTGGGELLKNIGKKFDTPFVSSNIVYSENDKNFVEPYLLKKVSVTNSKSRPPFEKLTIGVLGLCDEREALLHRSDDEAQLKSYDPLLAAHTFLPKLSKADLIVLVYNGRYSQLQQVLEHVDDVDIVIMGGEYYRANHYRGTDIVMASTPSLGKYFSLLTLQLDKNKNIISSKKRQIPLDESIPDNEELDKLVREFSQAKQNAPRVSNASSSR